MWIINFVVSFSLKITKALPGNTEPFAVPSFDPQLEGAPKKTSNGISLPTQKKKKSYEIPMQISRWIFLQGEISVKVTQGRPPFPNVGTVQRSEVRTDPSGTMKSFTQVDAVQVSYG